MNNYSEEEIRNILTNEVVEDIMKCKNENSKDNQKGRYGYVCGDKYLSIEFKWI